MAFSFALRRATSITARSAQVFFFQNCRSRHFPSLASPPVLKRVLSRAESNELPLSFTLSRSYGSIKEKPESDIELLRILDMEIRCAKKDNKEVEVPIDFPFEIEDEKGTNAITLRRNYLGETIEVVVSMPTVDNKNTYSSEVLHREEDLSDDDEVENADRPTIPLTVNISKGEGPNLEFCCTAYADDIVINSLFIRGYKESDDLLAYEGPEFSDLNERFQKAFKDYLKTRSISTETTNFIYQYLINKDDREHLLWLQNMNHFLQKQ